MRNNYPFFKYVPFESSIHQMNSKLKIMLMLLLLLSIILLRTYVSALILLLYLFYLMYSTKIKSSAYISNLILVWPLYVLIFIITLLVTFNFDKSLLMAIKFIYIILVLLILTFTTSLSEIAWGFECLFNKLNKIHIPVSKIALKIALGIKFIATLFEQFKVTRKSMAYRGVPYNKLNVFKSFKLMVAPSIFLSYKLSSRMGQLMKLRFYGSCKRRTNYHENKVKKLDRLLIFLSLVIVYISIWLGWKV